MFVVWVPCYYPVVYRRTYPNYGPAGALLPCRLYPEVDVELFTKSASVMERLMSEARLVLEQIGNSEEFANEMMGAAQESDQSKVDTLIQSAGVTSSFQAEYNPDRLKLNMASSVDQLECCKLTLILRWR